MDKKEWSYATRNHALAGHEIDISKAATDFKNKFSRKEQWLIIENLIKVRVHEFCLAYPNVLNVFCGYKVKDAQNKRGYSMSTLPTIVFVVRRKLNESDINLLIPKYILANEIINGEVTVIAIPTDVVSSAEHYDIELQANILVNSKHSSNGTGTTTCGIRVRNEDYSDTFYYISCRHVFSQSLRTHPNSNEGSEVKGLSGRNIIAHVNKVIGKFNPGKDEYSLDSQLSLSSTGSIDTSVRNIMLNGKHIKSSSEIPDRFYIQTDRGPILVNLAGFVRRQKLYYRNVGLLTHRYMIKSYFERDVTIKGDSGSPLTTKRNGGTLIGMHLGINSYNRRANSMAIPAWLLFDSDSYENVEISNKWHLYG